MKPFCLFTGSASSEIYKWLANKGVTMIQVHAGWADGMCCLPVCGISHK